MLPFVHWLPKEYFRYILLKLKMEFWTQEKNLNHISKTQLSMWTEKSKEFVVETIGIGLGIFKSNLVIYKP